MRLKSLCHLGFVLLLCALSTSCVYWRFYKLKGQLEDFPAHMRIEQREGPTLVLKHPVLRGGDPSWLVNLDPRIEPAGEGEALHVFRFVKEQEGPPTGAVGEVLELRVLTRGGMVEEVGFPAHFASFLTQENFMEVFLPIQNAMTSSRDYKTEWTWKRLNVKMPVRVDVLHHLGAPSAVETVDGLEVCRFNYGLEDADGDAEAMRMRYEFAAGGGDLLKADIQIGRLNVFVDLSGELKRVALRRAK